MKMNRKLLVWGTGAVLMVVANGGFAGQASSFMNHDISLSDACTVSMWGGSFGNYPIGSPDLIGQWGGEVDVMCAPGTPYRWGISAGSYWNSSDRQMSSGMYNIPYRLSYNGNNVGDNNLNGIDPSYIPTTPSYSGVDGIGNGGWTMYQLSADVLLSAAPAATPGYYYDTVMVTAVW